MKLSFLFASTILLLAATPSFSQTEVVQDSVHALDVVIVKAYAADRSLQEVPAAIAVVGQKELNRFSPVSILPAANMVPGVRMEERSPGSYRFSIRGSSLRSPFGVRNVKFYWNGLPLTDGGGNTYLNLIDFNSIGSMEVIKGPGGSLYGAGTGGVVLLASPKINGTNIQYSVLTGSYGLFSAQGSVALDLTKKFQLQFGLAYQKSDGYREQTKMNRLMTQINWRNTFSTKSFLSGTVFISGLSYQTPGGLTLAEYNQNPAQARPATATLPGAVDQKAAIKNQTAYLGLSFDHTWSERWSTRVGVFGSRTDFRNPAIRNYEKRLEENWGGRTDTQYKFEEGSVRGKITFGAEYQHFYSPDSVYDNLSGNPGNLQTADILRSELMLGFLQAEFDLPKNYFLTLACSGNFIRYELHRTSVSPELSQVRNFDPVFSPRIALLKKLSDKLSIYGSVSSGFSPPSLAEVRPSTGTFNNSLNPERGVSYEAGLKGKFFDRFDASLALYDFRLSQTIVIQPDATGADYFTNAGATSQQGAEVMIGWSPALSSGSFSSLRVWVSYTYNHYRFKDYISSNKDYSGNALTGISPAIVVMGGDLFLGKRFSFNLTANYSERFPLNDGNTDFASDYFILGARMGYQLQSRLPLSFLGGVDNALDQHYSLGNDLNATGGRYYNTAPGRNFYAGVSVRINAKPRN